MKIGRRFVPAVNFFLLARDQQGQSLTPADMQMEKTVKHKSLLALASAIAVLIASHVSASACGAGYKKVGNYCITKAYNPNLKLKAR